MLIVSDEFFSNPTGEKEGKKFIGEKVVATDASGAATFSFRPAAKIHKGVITATATNEVTSDTSEFSAPRRVVSQ